MPEGFKKYFKGDKVIWALFIVLAVISVLSVYSSSYLTAYRLRGGQVSYYMIRHLIFLCTGFILAYIAHLIPYRFYSRVAQMLLYISVPLLILTLLFGNEVNSAQRSFGLFGISFQTSDLAKLALIMYLARVLSLKQDKIQSFSEGFLPLIGPVLIICGLIFKENLSTALILFTVAIILMFIGRVKFKFIASLGIGTLGVLILVVFIAIQLNWGGRYVTWYNRVVSHTQQTDKTEETAKKKKDNYQADQSKMAIATGGILGKGPGNSIQRGFLPEPHSDFIYSIIVEEYGFFGGITVILIYLALLYRAGLIVRKSTRTFAAFLSFGLAILMVIQAMVNMGVAVGIFPVTGQPLPMISMGGTSTLFSSITIGMILSVSQGIAQERKEVAVEA